MRGIVRPCRDHLGPRLYERWQAHLCGLCLTLRDVAGQPERALTGYDVLLLSVLVEAQAGSVPTTEAAPCPLRGFVRATVVASESAAGRLAAAGALLTGSAGLADKVADEDLPRALRQPAGRVARRLARAGGALAADLGLATGPILAAPRAAAAVERQVAPGLRALLRPTGDAVAALFAHTAVVADRPANVAPLAACGQAFGQLVHLLDAVQDRTADRAAGRFNPLEVTGTDDPAAAALAHELLAEVGRALGETAFADAELADVLLGRELRRAVHRVLPDHEATCCRPAVAVPAQRRGGSVLAPLGALAALWGLLLTAVFGGGFRGGGGCGPRGGRYGGGGYPPPGYGYPPRGRFGRGYPPPGYGYRRGPSCGEMLACNCCANLACNACCCDCVDG
ncbi:MAG TPA: DUF5685 family protein [Frankiaceae bacterium]